MNNIRTIFRKSVLSALYWTGLGALIRPVLGGDGAILMFHRVSRKKSSPLGVNDHLSVTPEFLDLLLTTLGDKGYDFCTLEQLTGQITSTNTRKIALTLDDGYRDNLLNAVPVFERHKAPFTIYIAPELTNGTVVPWWEVLEYAINLLDQVESPDERFGTIDCQTNRAKQANYLRLYLQFRSQIPEQEHTPIVRHLAEQAGFDVTAYHRNALMDWDEVIELNQHPLCTIGAHGLHHYQLGRLSAEEAMWELETGKSMLEQQLGMAVEHLAFPYGNAVSAGQREAEMAQKLGFKTAVTTRHGLLQAGHRHNPWAMPRISVNGQFQKTHYVETLMSGFLVPFVNRGGLTVTV